MVANGFYLSSGNVKDEQREGHTHSHLWFLNKIDDDDYGSQRGGAGRDEDEFYNLCLYLQLKHECSFLSPFLIREFLYNII